MSEISEIEIKSMTKEQNYMRGYKDGKSDVLGRIREEIEEITDTMGVSYNQYVSKIDVFEIIDKYRGDADDKA